MNIKAFIVIFLLAITAGGMLFFFQRDNLFRSAAIPLEMNNIPTSQIPTPRSTSTPTPTPTNTPSPTPQTTVLLSIPFAPQAPLGEWKDSRFQDGCEEASVIMAIAWAKGETLTKDIVRQKIINLAAFQQEKYGEARDTSAEDTVKRIFNDYYNYQNVELVEDITVEDIKNELKQGNLVIVPANGQALGNPNFTPPGPERHNLVIKGYNDLTGEFITNDPGIRQGENYRYPQARLYNAIRDYPTGYHVPITEVNKVMIVVGK